MAAGMEGLRRQTSQPEGGQQPSKRLKVEEEEEHVCAVCGETVEARPGELFVLRRHYTEHFGASGLLQAAWGRRLRCPFPDCTTGNKAMKPLLLGLHLERTHGCLQALLEADSRPGIASALALLYPVKEEPAEIQTISVSGDENLKINFETEKREKESEKQKEVEQKQMKQQKIEMEQKRMEMEKQEILLQLQEKERKKEALTQ